MHTDYLDPNTGEFLPCHEQAERYDALAENQMSDQIFSFKGLMIVTSVHLTAELAVRAKQAIFQLPLMPHQNEEQALDEQRLTHEAADSVVDYLLFGYKPATTPAAPPAIPAEYHALPRPKV